MPAQQMKAARGATARISEPCRRAHVRDSKPASLATPTARIAPTVPASSSRRRARADTALVGERTYEINTMRRRSQREQKTHLARDGWGANGRVPSKAWCVGASKVWHVGGKRRGSQAASAVSAGCGPGGLRRGGGTRYEGRRREDGMERLKSDREGVGRGYRMRLDGNRMYLLGYSGLWWVGHGMFVTSCRRESASEPDSDAKEGAPNQTKDPSCGGRAFPCEVRYCREEMLVCRGARLGSIHIRLVYWAV
ncbi:hypothetical protein C8J57DRAFT_1213859 [Mycena rebaudengoi]|nr:hypothetical protein C8J57DRAFT_1213859 [Mycena rebaudengoi]